MACCSIRILSLIVAWLNTVGTTISAIAFVILMCLINSDFMKEMRNYDEMKGVLFAVFIVALILCCLWFAICVMLIVGINQNRSKLMAPYVYLTCAGIVIGVLGMVAQFILQIVAKQPFGAVLMVLLVNVLHLGFQILLFSPIYLLYKKIRSAPVLPEHHGLKSNEPLNKPHYMHGGHI